jgi:hypothetical protein
MQAALTNSLGERTWLFDLKKSAKGSSPMAAAKIRKFHSQPTAAALNLGSITTIVLVKCYYY